jgi:peptide deformylase
MSAKGKHILRYVDGQMIEYMEYELVDKYNKLHWTPTEKFDFSSPQMNPKMLAISLLKTMTKCGGVGLSANQVGLPYRVFVMGGGEDWFACFNPEIVEAMGETTKYDEGCLSYHGLFLTIKRAQRIQLKYQDHTGETQEKTFDGFTARVVQHEIDHLDGTSFIKKVPAVKLKQAQEKVKANRRRIREEQREARSAN